MIIIKHWLYGNLIFIGMWHLIYFGNVFMNKDTLNEISYTTFLWIITLLSISYTTFFTWIDYLLIFKKRYKDFNKEIEK